MRIVALLCLISPLLMAPQCGEPSATTVPAPPRPEIGRYQLFQGTVEFSHRSGNTQNIPTILRIDTVTGAVDRYSQGIDKDGKWYEGWADTTR